MEIDFLNISLAFLEGFSLIISPCILPILPIILSGSLGSGKKRPIGLILGFIITFSLFTFFSRKLVLYSGLDLNIIRNLSFILLLLFGLVMISDYLSDRFIQWTSRLENLQSKIPLQEKQGFWSGLLFGALIGLIWTPCAGPILAAVIVQTVLQKTTFSSFLTILSFGIGVAIPMFLIAFFGQKISHRLGFFKKHAVVLRKILGVIIILSVLFMAFASYITPSFGSYLNASLNTTNVSFQASNKNPSSLPSKEDISKSVIIKPTKLINGLMIPYQAPAIEGITAWINSPPLKLSDLKGKVVLIDFWAYSCINCVRTLPYLIDWYSKYKDQGFVIIGVHSPEFDFERDYNNVKTAVKNYGILYPVALDNNFTTWQNYDNQYWPAHYLIDKDGQVVYQHFGEGDYDVTENNIRFLLGLNQTATQEKQPQEEYAQEKTARKKKAKNTSMSQSLADFMQNETPETYLGYEREQEYHGNEPIKQDLLSVYSYPTPINATTFPQNAWALQGQWIINAEKITAREPNAAIKLAFYAGKVYAVMGSENNRPISVKVKYNGNSTNTETINETIVVTNYNLYHLLSLDKNESGIIELISTEPGLEIYTFTFGEAKN